MNKKPDLRTAGAQASDSEIGAMSLVQRRRPPRFAIVDERAQVVMTSADPGDPDWPLAAFPPQVAENLIAEIEAGAAGDVFLLTSSTTVVRATRLSSDAGPRYALFIEYVESRDLLANASSQYGLSQRELDVLRLILLGMDSATIAQQLNIAKGTVHAHVKNIGHKTQSTKRTEILAKLLGLR